MRKLFLVLVVILLASPCFSQIKKRATTVSLYTGIGYKFVFLTNPQARNAYPLFQLSNGDFLKELDGFLGVTINENYAVEFSPAYLFTNSVNSDGFYFSDNNGRRFYKPQQTRLFALPLNLRFKYFPFAQNYKSTLSKLYFGLGGGAMYANEEITNEVFTDDTRVTYLGAKNSQNNFWTSNFELLLGLNSFSKIGYGFELSYRFVPLNQPSTLPLITSLASNFNSINLAAKIVYTF